MSPKVKDTTGSSQPSSPTSPGFKQKLFGFLPSNKKDVADDSVQLAAEDVPPPQDLALQIQTLLQTLPAQPVNDPAIPNPIPKQVKVKKDWRGKPVPPAAAVPIHDQKMIALLSSPNAMNGGDDPETPSVWTELDKLNPANGDSGAAEGGDDTSDGPDDYKTVMFYGPLIPPASGDTQVELGQWRTVPIVQAQEVDDATTAAFKLSWTIPPWKVSATPPASVPTKRVWVPSTTKLTAKASWWGYELYLPPPVLTELGNVELSTVQRAAMITTALTWILGHLPSGLPPQLKVIIAFLNIILPYLSYIGVFVSWAWSEVDSYNQGNGVILGATWLLPVLLIPRTWPASQVPPATTTSPSSSTPPAAPASSTTPTSSTTPATSTPTASTPAADVKKRKWF